MNITQTITEFPHGSYVLVRPKIQLKPLKKGEPELMGPYLVVNNVEKILQHRGKINKKSSVEFLVRWEGYDPIDDSWLHWDHLIHNETMHTYLNPLQPG